MKLNSVIGTHQSRPENRSCRLEWRNCSDVVRQTAISFRERIRSIRYSLSPQRFGFLFRFVLVFCSSFAFRGFCAGANIVPAALILPESPQFFFQTIAGLSGSPGLENS